MAKEPDDPVYGEIKLSLRGLYHAGRVVLPQQADEASAATSAVAAEIGVLDSQAARCGNPKPLMDALSVLQDVAAGLRLATRNLNYGAVGLVHMADDFSATDEYAGEAKRNLSKDLTKDAPFDLAAVPPRLEDAVTGGEQPDDAPATPEDDLGDRDDSIDQPDLPDDVEADQ